MEINYAKIEERVFAHLASEQAIEIPEELSKLTDDEFREVYYIVKSYVFASLYGGQSSTDIQEYYLALQNEKRRREKL